MATAPTLDLGHLLVHLGMDISQYELMLKRAESKMKQVTQRINRLGRQLSLRVTAPLTAMGFASTKAFASFDQAMTKSLAIMNGVTPQLRIQMEDLALAISREGVTSAKGLGSAYFFLASAGLNAEQSMAALFAVEQFAVAGAFDMATATDLATDAQSALGLTVKDAQQNLINMTRVTDVLTGANTLANATTEQFSLALTSQAGPAMKAYNIQLEEGVAVLAAYADQGIKAQVAGSLFSRMLRLMTKGFKDNQGAWKQLGIDIFDATGELKPLSTIVGDLTMAFSEMSTEQKIINLELLGFKARSQQAILPLLGLQDKIAKYNKELQNMSGITREIAERQLKSFTNQMIILKNKIVEVGIEIGRILAPMILKLNTIIKSWTESWRQLSERAKRVIVIVGLVAAAIGPVLLAIGAITAAIGLIATPAFIAAASILAIVTAMIAVKNAPQISKFFFDEFKIVQQVTSQVVINMMKGWALIKFGFKQAVSGMTIVWNVYVGVVKSGIATILDAFALIPGRLGNSLNKAADRLRESISILGNVVPGANKEELLKQFQFLDQLSKEMFSSIEADFKEKEASKAEAAKASIEVQIKGLQELQDKQEEVNREFLRFTEPIKEFAASAADVYANLGEVAASAFQQMGDEMADFLVEGKANFTGFAKSVLKDILAIMIRARLVLPLVQALGLAGTSGPTPFSGGGEGGGSVRTAAKGDIFPGHFQAFANGGIVSSPTLGLIGEGGGPEAVVPLSGGRNIPVELRGGGNNTPPNVIINNNTGQELEQEGQPEFDGDSWVVNIVTKNINQFGSLRTLIGGIR